MSAAADTSPKTVKKDLVAIKRALVSVSDKRDIVPLAQKLADFGVELLSTGGTHKALTDAGLTVREVSEHTGFPEMMGGRLKTLHPVVHGGLLALRDNPDHLKAMESHAIAPIDLLISNLYPFEETVAKGGDDADCVENIDIGGPAMIRAAAKNHSHVAVLTDPDDYEAFIAELDQHDGAVSFNLRRRLAGLAYARTASYDAAISGWFAGRGFLGDQEKVTPPRISVAGKRQAILRYGENPHQSAALYLDGSNRPGVALADQLQGKELSYNNLNDTNAAFELVAEFDQPTIAIIKHANPCGVASADQLATAYPDALRCDPVSAFGGIIAANRVIDASTAKQIIEVFSEVVIAPEIDDEARAIFAAKKNLRVLTTGCMPDARAASLAVKTIAGGFLVQDRDQAGTQEADLKVVTKVQPSADQLADMIFAFRVAKHVKSNAIVYAKDGATVGIGAGQMSRVDSSRIAAWKANEAAEKAGLGQSLAIGSVVASDAFFPFADGLLAAAEAGAKAIIQPGGSMRDDEVIAAADEAGLAMVFTGTRHFNH
ncbi:MAG: bifunctional phosphoribosylaminoimidazolecarboxamide formyltransferase/IMP cyclohydrolase [Pseudomonadota bacterium]